MRKDGAPAQVYSPYFDCQGRLWLPVKRDRPTAFCTDRFAGSSKRERLVMRRHGASLILTSGGSYSTPLALSAEAHANTYRTFWDVFA